MKRLLACLLAALLICPAAQAVRAPDEDEIIAFACLIAAAPCVETDVSKAFWEEVTADPDTERCNALCVDAEDELVFACSFRFDHSVMSFMTADWRPDGEWLGAAGAAQLLDGPAQEQLCLQCGGWLNLVCPGAAASAPYTQVLDVQQTDEGPCWLVAFYYDQPESGAAPCALLAVQTAPTFRVLMLERR